MTNFSEKANFLWSIAELLRDSFKRSKYQDVILPFTVLRRIDCVLEPTKKRVLETTARLRGKGLKNLDPQLRKASGLAFYNISRYNFETLLDDPSHLASNLKAYINGFSENMREVLEKFDFDNTISKLVESNLLFLVIERFKNIDLHTDQVSNLEMGYIFEELIRRFNEALDENPGEHFTPREVIRLMVNLLLAGDKEALAQNHIIRTVYDPACGSGGMLTITKDRILEINPNAKVFLFGQEVNPETYAVSKSDLYMVSAGGEDAENIKFGSTLSNPQHRGQKFNYCLANPPYGKEWKMDKEAVEQDAERGYAGRFGAGLPRISDGQLLFLQDMISHIYDPKEGGTRIAIVMNGSPLFTGDAGSGESEIRRWVLENDWLETIVAMPEQLFYNTGIGTYVWILSNHKQKSRKGKVQLINAGDLWTPMRKSLGNKRREITSEHIEQICNLYQKSSEGDYSKVFLTSDFGYRKVTIERPLRLNFQVSEERLARIQEESAFMNLAVSQKKNPKAKAEEEKHGRKYQDSILRMIRSIPGDLYQDRRFFQLKLDEAMQRHDVKLTAALRKAILSALSERDEKAETCVDKEGNPEPDPELRDYENVPLKGDISEYFEREVKSHVPDAWFNKDVCDQKDGGIGKVGYEINFNRYFYKYVPPRPLEEIEADIRNIEKEILDALKEMSQ